MSILSTKTTYLFGLVNPKPALLPPGWAYLEDRHSFLRCTAPNGLRYYAREDGLERCLVASHADVDRTGGKLQLAQDYASGEIIPYPAV